MDDYEKLKLCAARFAWARRTKPVPSSEDPEKPQVNWQQWWERKFGAGETLDAFRARNSAQAHKTVLHDGGAVNG